MPSRFAHHAALPFRIVPPLALLGALACHDAEPAGDAARADAAATYAFPTTATPVLTVTPDSTHLGLPAALQSRLQAMHPAFRLWARDQYPPDLAALFPVGGSAVPSALVLDVNGDGLDDVVLSGHTATDAVVLLGVSIRQPGTSAADFMVQELVRRPHESTAPPRILLRQVASGALQLDAAGDPRRAPTGQQFAVHDGALYEYTLFATIGGQLTRFPVRP